MAAFRDGEAGRLDYRLLRDGPVVKYFRRAVLAEDAAWLGAHGYVVDFFDARADPMDDIARVLEFPDYFGGNLNALHDCLCDVSIPDEGGRALIFDGIEKLLEQDPSYAWNLLDVLATGSHLHLLFGRRLLILVRSEDPRLMIPSLGGRAVGWNAREWSDRARGV